MLSESEFQFPTVEHEIPDKHPVCDLQIRLKCYIMKCNELSVCAPTSFMVHLPLSLLSDYWLSVVLKKNNT